MLPLLTLLPWLTLTVLSLALLLRNLVELAANVLDLGAQLGVRIGLGALARHGFRIRERLRFLGVALQIAQRRRRHGVGRGDLRAGAAQDRVAAVAEPRARLHALQVGERLIQCIARLRRLLAELLRDALDVFLEGLELLLQIVLALGELLGLIVGYGAAPPLVRVAGTG